MFLYYANEESDDVIGGSIWTVKHRIKNISRNIGAVFFKLGTKNVHHKRNRKTPSVLLPWQHFWLQSGAHHQEPPSPIQTLWDNLCAYLFIFRTVFAQTSLNSRESILFSLTSACNFEKKNGGRSCRSRLVSYSHIPFYRHRILTLQPREPGSLLITC